VSFCAKTQKSYLTSTLYRVHHVGTEVLSQPLPLEGTDDGPGGEQMSKLIRRLWSEDAGQDIAEYAVMLAVILVLVVGTVRLIGSSANNAFSSVASSLQ
jgi:Flp pilus assembly pilin Flp